MKYAIEAQGLGKCYKLRGLGPQTLFGSIHRAVTRQPPQIFWAIRNADFKIPKGSTVGVIGPNGAGKSSTLGLAAGTITPTEGTIRAEGRISSLLELGAGFHPDLTGRENVYLNAALLGIPREDIRKRFDAILDFSGLHDFIDQPVKNYSSGMYVRLGFAVATEVDPDILLVDEVLAVGDIAFQLKCLDRIRKFQKKGKTLMFVSHALQTVEEFCDEAYLVYKGDLVKQGPPPEVILEMIRNYSGEGGTIYAQEFGTREIEITDVKMLNEAGENRARFDSGTALTIQVDYEAHQEVDKPVFGYSLKTANGMYVYGTNTQIENAGRGTIVKGPGTQKIILDPLTLREGNYFLSLSIHSWDHATQFHRREDWYPFAVKNTTDAPGMVTLPTRFV
ncbi:ABC transporter ATP-binding protein [Kiritimatiellaeota bacterium B1221]|nr:ABC transporter ATP-binding protein [Kiritimatiellaeota bacterium B1221]